MSELDAASWVRLELDAAAFDAARFAPYVENCRAAGIGSTTMAALGDGPEPRRALYELNKECSADIPGRGAFSSYEENVRVRFEAPSYDPRGVVIAYDGDAWIGMSATSDHRADGFVFNEMTGVRAPYRGRGISLALKTLGIAFAGLCGVSRIRTVHHAANTRAIAMNRRLGYTDAPTPAAR
ncbi:GNAT family N-acetyltransferase [Streptomyces sp. NPDC060031]|uniref:GNAT family N-acetyltransferase n=1 Tax=Streptomyces sp. NPDC060031 TaxID=3347043 RepID=UPI003693005F